MEWNRFYMKNSNNDKIYWIIRGPLRTALIAGLMTAAHMLISEYEEKLNEKEPYDFVVSEDQFNNPRTLYSLEDLGYKSNLPVGETDEMKNELPDKGEMGIWIYSNYNDRDKKDYWKFVQVDNMSLFMQGFISMCNAFQVDFRDYIWDLPIDSNGVQYDIPTYRIKEYLEEPKPDEEYKQDEEYEDGEEELEYQDEYADY